MTEGSVPIAVTLAAAVFTVFACSDSPDCLIAPDGLVHFWTGDGSGEDLVAGADATLLSGATFTPGFVSSGTGEAFLFDGVDANARVVDMPSLRPTTGFTLNAWARLDSDQANSGPVVGKGRHQQDSYAIDHVDGVWRGFVRDAAGVARQVRGGPFRLGEWTHLALTWDGTNVRFYVDGAHAGTEAATGVFSTDSFLGIGYRSEEGFDDDELDFEFAGAVDEVGYFDRALDAVEVAEVFAAASDGICKDGSLPDLP